MAGGDAIANASSAQRRGIIEIGSGGPMAGDGNGLKGEYFNNIGFTGSTLNRTDATVNFDWGSGSPAPRLGQYIPNDDSPSKFY
ncbi:MAG: hypothetical protein AAF921_14425 [Cyanobacteria bacterium P01_D01_bin.44]